MYIHMYVYTYVCIYRRSGFDCVVKRLRMALYKPDCDFNDCELPSGQYIINCIFFFLRFFRLRVMEKLAIRNQKNLAIKTRPTVADNAPSFSQSEDNIITYIH